MASEGEFQVRIDLEMGQYTYEYNDRYEGYAYNDDGSLGKQTEGKSVGSTEFGLKPTGDHVKAVTEMPYPVYEDGKVNMTSLRSFIGMCKYLRRYLKDCAKHCMKLNELLCSDSDGKWTEEHARAWDALKHDVAITKGVWHPNYHHPIYVCTDGSKHGIGGYVYQLIDGEERVISYYSRSTTADERKWDGGNRARLELMT